MSACGLSQAELERYDRQMRIWGVDGQMKLKRASVMIVGAGGLGSPVALYLAAAGVKRIAMVDREKVELSNLNRQILHWTDDIGKPKVISAVEKLRKLNPHVEVEGIAADITEGNALELLEGFDLVIDCLDNWRARFLLNEACVKLRKPLIHAGVHSWYGQITTIVPGEGPCLRCIWPRTPPEEGRFPIVGPTAGILGVMEAAEAIKVITGLGRPLIGRMLYVDLMDGSISEVSIKRAEGCPACGSI